MVLSAASCSPATYPPTRAHFLPYRYADAVLEAVQQLGLLVSGQTPDKPGIDSDDGWGIFVFFCIIMATVVGWAWFSQSRQNARFKVSAGAVQCYNADLVD
jgi:hypothetical protein